MLRGPPAAHSTGSPSRRQHKSCRPRRLMSDLDGFPTGIAMKPTFGTLEWGKKNNGVLTRTERLHFLRNMAVLAARDRLVGPGSGRRLQATDAVGRLRRVAAGADRLGAVYAAGSGGGVGRARDQDPS